MRHLRMFFVLAAILFPASVSAQTVRVKDIASVQGARSNQLTGLGLVVGLDGSGDSNSTLFSAQMVVNLLARQGVNVPQGTIKVKNIAAVMVTAELPPFVRKGSRINVTVNSLGDARSLQGGTLLQTPLKGADDQVYAVAQGPLSIGGFNFSAGGSTAQKNHVTVGRIPRGALVEREVSASITDGKSVEITLNDPDLTTANRVAEAIRSKLPDAPAEALDAYTIRVGLPPSAQMNLVGFLAKVEALSVTPDAVAKIVVNERTGTVVVGGNVRVSPCAIAHGSIQVRVDPAPVVAIPPPFSENGQPVVLPLSEVSVRENPAKLATVPETTTIDQLVRALNALGVTPRDLIAILQLMKAGGHIAAEIEVL